MQHIHTGRHGGLHGRGKRELERWKPPGACAALSLGLDLRQLITLVAVVVIFAKIAITRKLSPRIFENQGPFLLTPDVFVDLLEDLFR